MVTPVQRRAAVTEAQATAGISERCACRFTGFARSSQRYPARRDDRAALRARLHTLALLRPRWGYRRLYVLLRREGHLVNRKLVQRLYREEGLTVRRRRRKRVAVPRTPLAPPAGANERWSMDFVSDALADGRKFRSLTLVDDFTRECPVIEVDVSLSGERVAQVLDRVAAQRGLPRGIVCDNGPAGRPAMQGSRQSSPGRRWISGRIGAGSRCCSSSRASRCRMRMRRASTGDCATSA